MEKLTVQATIHAPVEKVWECYTDPAHITKWNFASDDWHSPTAKNDLRTGGKFKNRMEARDGSAGFDFTGTYTEVVPHEKIAYVMDDGREAQVLLTPAGEDTHMTVSFDPETENPHEMQVGGWQAILDNFKKHTEAA